MNNSIKPSIAVTKEDREKFARRFKANMPQTFSGVIFHAADALEEFVKRDDTEVDMGDWHYIKNYDGRGLVCVACLAGVAMIDLCGATGLEYSEQAESGVCYRNGAFDYGPVDAEMSFYESIVDDIRNCLFLKAFNQFNEYFLGRAALDSANNTSECIEAIGDRFWEEAGEYREEDGSPEYIACLRHSAEEVKALGL